ncbi:MAG: ribosomal protein S18-alanine N-acetyltransferase [Hydrogenothermaceae bacterium]|nr:ribosomal protein S18-alanine N-acetyltransferase [Hydrogenothermaceae bacterium]
MQILNFNIISYEDKYLNQVLDLLNSVFDFHYTEDYINTGLSEKYVVLENGKVIGFFEFSILSDLGEIFMIAVDKNFHGKGIGKVIMEFILEKMKEENVKEIYLDVSVNNKRAINFYKKYGFEELYIREKYYRNLEDAILMKKQL